MESSPASPASFRSMATFQDSSTVSYSPNRASTSFGSAFDAPAKSESSQLGAATFGMQPTLIGPSTSGRAKSYSFTIKKWASIKGTGQGLTMAPRLAGDLTENSALEVTFEWVKGKNASRRSSEEGGGMFERTFSAATATQLGPNDSTPRGKSQVSVVRERRISISDCISPRTSVENLRPFSPAPSTTMGGRSKRPVSMISVMGTDTSHDDAGVDSDPEDSETPWYCVVRCPGTTARQSEGSRPVTVIATLHPAPHHPRVVGQLKIPLDLGCIPTGLVKPLDESSLSAELEEVILTEENLKDVVGVTAMWLVVREEFGGLGKKKKA